MLKSLYIASSLQNIERVRYFKNLFATQNIDVTYDWTTHGHIADPVKCGEIAKLEIQGVLQSKCVFLILPGRYGSHFELGVAYMACIPIVILFDEQIDSVSFHHLPEIHKYTVESDAVKRVLEIIRSSQ